jgi:RecA/RadA recombinase
MAKELNPVTDLTAKFINTTGRHIFLTGKAGTGKTTFLKHIVNNTHKNTIVAAPTGIAAINAGGVTLHSLFQLPFGAFIPSNYLQSGANISTQITTPKSLLQNFQMNKTKRSMLQELELLIIDEVSMLRADLLDAIDTILRFVRKQGNVPFGGVQIMFIGDLLQLPPVVKENEWEHLRSFYDSIYFFKALALKNNPPIYLELEKIYRQTDNEFISLLNNLRENRFTDRDIVLLNKCYKPDFETTKHKGYIFLTTHNRKADAINSKALEELKSKSYSYDAVIEGDFNEYNFPVEQSLILKEGAQIMFIKNDYSGEQRYFNGKLGMVLDLTDDSITVSFEDGTPPVVVEPYTWENKKYSLNKESSEIEEKLVGKFIHYPLKLAWAITVHKSQGLTFEKAVIDVSKAFAPGQIYVALSRLTSLNGLVLTASIPTNSLACDKDISEYSRNGKSLNELESDLNLATREFVADSAIKAFDFNWLSRSLGFHVESYDKDEKRSIKQLYKNWAITLKTAFEPTKKVADNFTVQITRIVYEKKPDMLDLLYSRINSAKNYFEPLLNEQINIVNEHIKDLSTQKRIKKYLNELMDVERLFVRQLQKIHKAEALIKSAIEKTEFSKESLKDNPLFRSKKVNKSSKKLEAKSKSKKEKKTPTKEVSFQMFKEGKTIQEIALERDFVQSTIEGHLAHFVGTGDIDILQLVDEDVVGAISKFCKENETMQTGDIKSGLGNDVTYGQIKLVQAHLNRE